MFPDKGSLELSGGSHDGEHEVAHGGVVAGEEQVLLDEFHPRAFARQALNEGTQVIEGTA